MQKLTVGLIGNPNSGKTTLFNQLTGARQRVGNWAGVTVERKEGVFATTDHQVTLVDLPVLTGGTAPAPPPPAPETYVVQPGDTLSGIGAKVGVPWQSIAQANGINDPNLIYVGQVLRIPR